MSVSKLKNRYHLITTQWDNKGNSIAFMLVWVDKNGKEHPRKP